MSLCAGGSDPGYWCLPRANALLAGGQLVAAVCLVGPWANPLLHLRPPSQPTGERTPRGNQRARRLARWDAFARPAGCRLIISVRPRRIALENGSAEVIHAQKATLRPQVPGASEEGNG